MNITRGVVLLARGGYAARGLVYGIIAFFAITATIGAGQTVDTRGALQQLLGTRYGDVLLWIVLVGLVAYAAWRLTQAIGDTDRHGSDGKGLLIRAGLVGSAVVYLLLALFTMGLLGTDLGGAASGAGQGGDFLSGLLGYENSNLIIYAIALVPLGVGIAHLIKARQAKFARYFQCDGETMRWVRPVSQIGLAARGIVFLIMAALLFIGGNRYEPTDPPGLQAVFSALQGLPWGWLLLLAMAIGLLAFAIYSFAEARWRRINVAEVMH